MHHAAATHSSDNTANWGTKTKTSLFLPEISNIHTYVKHTCTLCSVANAIIIESNFLKCKFLHVSQNSLCIVILFEEQG